MESVIVVSPIELDLGLMGQLNKIGQVTGDLKMGFVLNGNLSRVYINRNDAIRGEFDRERLEAIQESIPNPIFYTVDFSDISLCKKVLEIIADNPNLLIDNDHGLLLPGNEFVRILKKERDWDWRDGVT